MSERTLPDPASRRTETPPNGYHYEWVVETMFGWMAWRVVDDPKQCRSILAGRRCEAPSVAMLNRGRPGKREQWWHYCADHMYGRVVHGRRVWVIHTIRDAS